jgi:hypothetical protein
MTRDGIIDELRDAAAVGRLLVVTGAGISAGLKRPKRGSLPNWGQLVQALRRRADPARIDAEKEQLLDVLLPAGALSELNGDVLIEASEILQAGFDTGEFEKTIARLCRERDGECSDTHVAITELEPVGVVTFNYDRAHEEAFRRVGVSVNSIHYGEDAKLKALLAGRNSDRPYVLKAHGCVSRPETLVLTSSSYRQVLSRFRAYRLFLQHALIQHTVLIVGFAMRDRDFDQLLETLEMELGEPLHRHAFIAKAPPETRKGKAKRAEWAAITSRFGVSAIYVDEFKEIPELIRSLATVPGPLVKELVEKAVSGERAVRERGHDDVQGLGRIGLRQVRAALFDRLDRPGLDPQTRSELVYALKDDREALVARRLMREIKRAVRAHAKAPHKQHTECVAHALLAIRRSRLPDARIRREILRALRDPALVQGFDLMDNWIDAGGDVRRVADYARAAAAEIEARGLA